MTLSTDRTVASIFSKVSFKAPSKEMGKNMATAAYDFAFIVHPRNMEDIFAAYPDLRELPEAIVNVSVKQFSFHELSDMDVTLNGSKLRGKLLALPYLPKEMLTSRREVVDDALDALEHCASLGIQIVGLGALIPSISRAGVSMADRNTAKVGVTTGHTFTAVAIHEYLRAIEEIKGTRQTVAIVGSAGSVGRAVLKLLAQDDVPRRLIGIDLQSRMERLRTEAGRLGLDMEATSDINSISRASVVICVTNATRAIISPDMLAKGAVVIDDAQPENVSIDVVRERPDVKVIKCLAHVPGLRHSFDFGLFGSYDWREKSEITFTCLAETILLAADGHSNNFTIGDPTEEQMNRVKTLAAKHNVSVAPFQSFPEIGVVEL